jgi:Homing endonuclease associated repeat
MERAMTKDEIVAIIKECAAELGHVPNMAELERTGRIRRYHVDSTFGSYMAALEVCGLKGRGSGYRVADEELAREFALVVRKLGRIPTTYEYRLHAERSIRPFLRCFKAWSKVPHAVVEYLGRPEDREGWEDVLEILERRLKSRAKESGERSESDGASPSWTQIHYKNTFYGPPLFPCAVTYAPVNELGVMVLFAALAKDLGFTITHIQTQFPDGEVMREVEPGRHQRLPVEFEYESRNFVTHGHPVDGCKLIICWKHNWPECPLEVLELKSVVEKWRK